MERCSQMTQVKLQGIWSNSQMEKAIADNLYSHLMGLFYRTIRMVENGIKPAYVFDGKPPELKAGVVSSLWSCLARVSVLTRIFSSLSDSNVEKRQSKKVKKPRKQVSEHPYRVDNAGLEE